MFQISDSIFSILSTKYTDFASFDLHCPLKQVREVFHIQGKTEPSMVPPTQLCSFIVTEWMKEKLMWNGEKYWFVILCCRIRAGNLIHSIVCPSTAQRWMDSSLGLAFEELVTKDMRVVTKWCKARSVWRRGGEQEWGGGEGGQEEEGRMHALFTKLHPEGKSSRTFSDQHSLSNGQRCTFVICAKRSLA